MGNQEEVKKILMEWNQGDTSIDEPVNAICSILEAECQARVERIFRVTEEGMAKSVGYDNIQQMLDGGLELPDYWQNLKKQEGKLP